MAKQLSRNGHRQRLRDLYIKNGIAGMSEHNIIELLLAYAIPRRDVKKAAYKLYNRFDGNLNEMFAADADELCSVGGVGKSAAVLIKLFGDIPEYIKNSGKAEGELVFDYITAKDYVNRKFSAPKTSSLVLVSIDNSNRIISTNKIAEGNFEIKDIPLVDFIECALKDKASSAIIVHSKAGGNYVPDKNDEKLLKRISDAFAPLEIRLRDYITIGKDGSLSMSNDIRYLGFFMK